MLRLVTFLACAVALVAQQPIKPSMTSDKLMREEARAEPHPTAGETRLAPAGSPYVPIDSWVYPALDRLGALGLIPSQIVGLRPWTRQECHRQAVEAEDTLRDKAAELGDALVGEADGLINALRSEFEAEDVRSSSVVLESVSARNGVIAGTLLNDSQHFGQTWINDFGRPFGRGWNSYAGLSARAVSGRFFAAVRAEYQHAPGRDPYPLHARQLISSLDGIPLPAPQEKAAVDRFRSMEAYAGMRVGDLEISLGKQSLFWGPTYDAPLSFSSNAEPTKNLRVSLVHPLRLPGPLGWLGRIRGEYVIGKLGGHAYTWRPWFNAQKLSFKLTDNLEMGFTRWSIFWGVGHPITMRSFFRNLFSASSTGLGGFPDPTDPGDRKGGFDFRYRIPWMRKWLTIYSDSYCDDDPSPLAAPRRAAFSPGIYMSYIPGIPKLDLRVEVASTEPFGGDHGGNFIYWNGQYRSGNTNYGKMLGSWVGRDARAIQGWSTYWLSARNKIEIAFRHSKGGSRFLPGGSSQTAGKVTGTYQLARDWYVETMVQWERFWVPALGGPHRNVSAWLRLTWEPKLVLYEQEKQK